MKRLLKRAAAAGLAAAMMLGMTACGSTSAGSSEGKSTDFTFLLSASINSFYYLDYDDNPIMKYWTAKEWDVDGDKRTITIDFSTLPTGSEQDTMNTLMATGEYSDVICMDYCTETAASLYDQGIALDLTEYVDQYMPNYKAWMEAHPEIADGMYNVVDGEQKILQLYQVGDTVRPPFTGWVYRRDWIVKYGTNPETGEAFTGGYTDDSNSEWKDDVVFPSGGSDPIYISDWEWMFEIFEKALKAEGISDGYAFQINYAGDDTMGDLTSTFIDGNSYYYLDEDGVCQFGGESDGYRAYIECLTDWYEKGWVNQNFEENAQDVMFWKVDTPVVYAGKAGMWYGARATLGNGLATGEDDYTKGICTYAAPYPINDVYGDDDAKGNEPTSFYSYDILNSAFVVTDKAADKDIAALLTAIDYLYSDEGGLLMSRGFSKEQYEETQDEFYTEWGLEDGAYSYQDMDGEEYIVLNPRFNEEDNLSNAADGEAVAGMLINDHVDIGLDAVGRRGVELWSMYEKTSAVGSWISGQMSADDASETSLNTTNIRTYISQEVPNFITGRKDITSDADWEAFCQGLSDYDPYKYCDCINEILGK